MKIIYYPVLLAALFSGAVNADQYQDLERYDIRNSTTNNDNINTLPPTAAGIKNKDRGIQKEIFFNPDHG